MGRCVLTSVTGKFNSTNHRPGLGLILELPTVSGPMRGQGFSGTVMELKFIDGVSQTFFSLGILNDEA